MPTDSRIRSAGTPASFSCSSLICRWVVLAGWSTQVRRSATWVTTEAISRLSINLVAASRPPFTPKDTTPQVPWGMYFWARACWGLLSRPG